LSVSFVALDELIDILKTEAVLVRSKRQLKHLMNSNLVINDEVGFLPVIRQEANIFYQLVAHFYPDTSVKLFALEREIHDATPEERYQIRLERSLPVMEAFLAWLKHQRPRVLAKSAFS